MFVQYLELAVNPRSEQLAKTQIELESVSNIALRITPLSLAKRKSIITF